MTLPKDFDDTLIKVDQLGIKGQDAAQIRDHLILSIKTAAQEGKQLPTDLGFIDWSVKILNKCEKAVHDQICDGQGVKQEYKNLVAKQMTDDSVRTIALTVTSALTVVNPVLVVSPVVIYFSLWLAKVGLNYWCKQGTTAN